MPKNKSAILSFMKPIQISNILHFLALCPGHSSVPYRPKPRHWKSNQQFAKEPRTVGEQIKKRRLEIGWFQRDVAAKIGISSASVSDWERGVTVPSRRMKKKIQEFLKFREAPVSIEQRFHLCKICGMSESSPERCLFENICK
jgi:DNA-binding XRE family transcriptional regulator